MAGIKYYVGLVGGAVVFLAISFFTHLDPGYPEVSFTLAVAMLMAIWWITEVVPLAVTSLIPVVLFPVFGIMDGRDVSATYFNHVIFLFIGGFIVALAMQKWNLHKRIALKILMITGVSPGRILLGFMLSTSFLSMWISNTATTMMMVPILLSIIHKLEEILGKKEIKRYSIGLLLGVAYSASIGGIATLVGTPPNLSFARIFQIMFPLAPEISFASWFVFAFPISVIFFTVVWVYLYLIFKPKHSNWKTKQLGNFRQQYSDLGKFTYEEKSVLIVFVSLALLWLTRSTIQLGSITIPGWSSLFPKPGYFNDGTVAILSSLALFIIPAKGNNKEKLMDWDTAKKIPWNIVLLFGGGFALASGFKASGLSIWFGTQLNFVGTYHPLLIIMIICLLMTFLTELTSNTATTEMLLPILAGLSVSVEINPLLFMLPATLSGSMAFMLPVATPPNAIVFGSGRLRIADMARNGLVLNLLGVIIISLFTWFVGTWVFGIDINNFPAWAVISK
ncbi:MAG: SLC13 family permease [Bacteroidales bacterium]|nr:SLC13 family permease [Bacteroidales bacterium]MCF8403424.1 SLC13 family permease [Bacteroidales bacterium]